MSGCDTLSDLERRLSLDLTTAELTPAPTIPTTEFIRPCQRIEPETKEFAGFSTLADRFAALTA